VGSINCISKRAVVFLPQPLSPTTPSVSPAMTWKFRSSTARNTPPPRPNPSFFSGKCFTKPCTDNSGATIT